MQSNSNQLRQPNLMDVFRLFGALAIIWYHNPFYWQLGESTNLIDILKLGLIGWAMPFFYSVTSKYALLNYDKKRLIKRILNVVMLMLIYTIIYELIPSTNLDQLFIYSKSCDFICVSLELFERVRTVSNSPGYFLSDLMVIIFLGFFCSINLGVRAVVITIITLNVIYLDGRVWGIFLNPLAGGCFIVAQLYLILIKKFDSDKNKFLIKIPLITSIFIFLISWAVLNIFYAQNEFWKSTLIFLSAGLLLWAVLFSDRIDVSTSSFLSCCSKWGQKYAFGIFILHQLIYDLIAPIYSKIIIKIHISNPILNWVMLGLFVSILTVLLVSRLASYAPKLFRI
jgi:hypothetical protein